MSQEKNKEIAFKLAGALIVARKFRRRGAPLSKIREIFKKFGIDPEIGFYELQKRFEAIGLKLVIISEKKEKELKRVFAIIDPTLNLDEIKPYSGDVLTVLAFIYNLEENGRVPLLKLTETLKDVFKDDETVRTLITRGITRLKEDGIIKIEAGNIILTPIGKAMKPSPELIDKALIEALSRGRK